MKRRILITGMYGFLGGHAALIFERAGWDVTGIDCGIPPVRLPAAGSRLSCHNAAVTLTKLRELDKQFDCIFHCAGTGSVGFSVEQPLVDFEQNVTTTVHVLEYARTSNPQAKIIIPSSLAVYGEQPDAPIPEEAPLAPVSPYGVHKKAVEEVGAYYTRLYGLHIGVIRFFSLYGPHLRKQLLWEACRKITEGKNEKVSFFGTGAETRDWLHIEDAVALTVILIERLNGFMVINGGSGEKTENRAILSLLADSLHADPHHIAFTGSIKPGDPRHCQADMTRAFGFGWRPLVPLEKGIAEYVAWFTETRV